MCFICCNKPEENQVKCRNLLPYHLLCKGCFTTYVQAQAKALRTGFNAENLECPVPDCKVKFAPKTVKLALSSVQNLT